MPGVEVRAGATGPTADPRRGYAALMGTEVVDVKASPGSRWGRDHDRNAPSDGAGEPLAPRLACDEAQAHIQGLPQLGALLGFAQEPTPGRRRGSPAPRGLRRGPPPGRATRRSRIHFSGRSLSRGDNKLAHVFSSRML